MDFSLCLCLLKELQHENIVGLYDVQVSDVQSQKKSKLFIPQQQSRRSAVENIDFDYQQCLKSLLIRFFLLYLRLSQ